MARRPSKKKKSGSKGKGRSKKKRSSLDRAGSGDGSVTRSSGKRAGRDSMGGPKSKGPQKGAPKRSVKGSRSRTTRAQSSSSAEDSTPPTGRPPAAWLIALALLLIVVVVFWRAVNNQFINLDDGQFVYDNPYVKSLTWSNVAHLCGVLLIYWMPLTWLSHAVTYQFVGLEPAGHHLVNVVLHGINTSLLFLVVLALFRWAQRVRRGGSVATPPSGTALGGDVGTSTSGPTKTVLLISAGVALVWALHPLRVEAVAWVAERKEVLSACFSLAACLAYLWAANRPGRQFRLRLYACCLPLHLCALMSKPMAMTLPVVLLLLDIWPLGRVNTADGFRRCLAKLGRLAIEKIPFFVLSVIVGIISLRSERSLEDFSSPELLQFGNRLNQAIRSLSFYFEKTLWPDGLVVYYPRETYSGLDWWPVGLSLALLIGAMVLAYRFWRRGRVGPAVALAVYLVTVFPVLGILRVGNQIRADRWTYIPTISALVLGGFLVLKLIEQRRRLAVPAGVLTAIILVLLSILTMRQTELWKDSRTLWEANIARYPDRIAIAHVNLGTVLPPDEAQRHYETAIRLAPRTKAAHNNLGRLYVRRGELERATKHYRQALQIDPSYATAHNNLATVYAMKGQRAEAAAEYRKAIELNPDYTDAHLNLGLIMRETGDIEAAQNSFDRVLQLQPENARVRHEIARIYETQGKIDEAIRMDAEAIELDPQLGMAYLHASALLFNANRLNESLTWLVKAAQQFPNNGEVHKKLGLLHFHMKDFKRAGQHLRRAVQLGAKVPARYLNQIEQ